jgi:hypothetical protein
MRIAGKPLRAIRKDFAVDVSTRKHLQMMIRNAPMSYVSCPTAVINAPVDAVWALLMEPAAWGGVFDMRVGSISMPHSEMRPEAEVSYGTNIRNRQ